MNCAGNNLFKFPALSVDGGFGCFGLHWRPMIDYFSLSVIGKIGVSITIFLLFP